MHTTRHRLRPHSNHAAAAVAAVRVRNTRKNSKSTSTKTKTCALHSAVILKMIEMLNTVKLFHWHTCSYPTHKATDELYSSLNDSVDSFVEVMLGKAVEKRSQRFDLTRTRCVDLCDFKETDVESFKMKMEEYKTYLVDLAHLFKGSQHSDLMNIRDEMLAALNKTSYLLTLH